MRLSAFKALSFDVYGTLIDWESGMIAGLRPLTDRLAASPGRNAVLEAHAAHEARQQALTPTRRYSELLATVYRRIAEDWGLTVSWDECLAYGRSVPDWPAFPDSAAALGALKQRFKLYVLTNTDNVSFSHSNAKLGVAFDGIYTAEDIGAYKPAARTFEFMLEALDRQGIARHELLHVAESLFHDHVPARRLGLATCWIHRRHADAGFGATLDPGTRPEVDVRFTSLAEMVEGMRGGACW